MGGPDLSKVPKHILMDIAASKNIELHPRERINSIRMKLYENLSYDELIEYTIDHVFAGRTSSVYFKYSSIEGRTQENITGENIGEILTLLCNGRDPFDYSSRPDLTSNFQIINARYLDNNNKLLISFAKKGHEKWLLDGYRYRTYTKTDWINSIMYLNDNIFEARAAKNLAKKCSNYFFNHLLAQDDLYIQDAQFKMIRDSDFIRIKNKLNARVRTYKGRDITGKYQSREITGHKQDNLYDVDGFQEDIGDLDTPNSKLIFDSPTQQDYEIVIRVNTQEGYITFLSPYASEGDMDYVYNALKTLNIVR